MEVLLVYCLPCSKSALSYVPSTASLLFSVVLQQPTSGWAEHQSEQENLAYLVPPESWLATETKGPWPTGE